MESKLNRCECGGEPEYIKFFKNREQGFYRCPKCGRETKSYTSRQNARKAWNAGRYEVE